MHNEFDEIANSYDDDFTNSEIGKLQRDIVWKYLDKQNITGKNILEINCGTGEDAVYLSKKGNHVTATDVSEQMLQAAQHKFIKNNLTVESFIWDLNKPFPLPAKKYDLIFSNFGGLNCLSPEALKKLSLEFNQLLNADGRLIFVVMGRFCLWETFYFLFKGKFKSAFRRLSKEPVKAKLNDNTFVDTWYYSAKELNHIFSEHFKYINKKPVGVFIPPSYMENYFKNEKTRMKILMQTEKSIGGLKFLAPLSDHFLIELRQS
ncbi:MAG: methyltransferase domain-containing protein [Fimbriimonadaceae bacterium]|nr:methyltransferase domain-containing protein [Chitinophagales bacterium]